MKVQIITNCPSCDSLLEGVKDQLFCRNTSCGAVSNKKVLHYIKTLKIKGLGEKTVEKLGITSILDIYELLDTSELVQGIIGEKLTTKLLSEIKIAKTVDLGIYVAAFGIPLVGLTIANKLSTKAARISDITFELCREVGIGEKASTNLANWAIQYEEELPITLTTSVKKEPKPFTKTICITGKIEGFSRPKLKTLLESNGIKLATSVTGNTDYLIAAEGSTSSKHKTAQSKGIPILTFNQFINKENIKL